MLAEIVDGRIRCDVDFANKELVKAVPGSSWSSVDRQWSVPLSWAACKQLRGLFGPDLEVGPELTRWAWKEYAERVYPALVLRGEIDLPETTPPHLVEALAKIEAAYANLGGTLFKHQRPDALFLVAAGSDLLANEPGTGKTLAVITALRILHEIGQAPLPALVVCPNTIKLNWRNEIAAWWPEVAPVVISNGAGGRRKALAEIKEMASNGEPVIGILNWEAVRRHSRLAPYGNVALKHCEDCDPSAIGVKRDSCHRCPRELNAVPWRTVIADEAHRMKEPQSQQTRAVWAVGHGASVQHRWPMTGTPIGSTISDLWSILHFCDPVEHPGRSKYLDRYALMTWNIFGGLDIIGVRPDTQAEFFSIVDPRMRRMPKELVLPNLPPKLPQLRHVEMKGKQAKAYKQMQEHMITMLDKGTLMALNPLAQMTRLVQFSSAYAELQADGSVRLSEPSCKLDEMMVVLDELGGEPVVIMAESRQLIELATVRLEAAGITYSKIVGGMSDAQRQQSVDDFQSGRVRCCLFTFKAGGVGLTLTRAGHAIALQRSWSLIDNRQADDRIHRIGSEIHDKVLIIELVTQGTVEEEQIAALWDKDQRFEQLVRDRDTVSRLLKPHGKVTNRKMKEDG